MASSSSGPPSSTSSAVSRLTSASTQDVLQALHDIKAKRGKTTAEKVALVKPLIKMLERPNSKIVDVSLSILGGLVMETAPRKQVIRLQLEILSIFNYLFYFQFRHCGGVRLLVGLLGSLGEESILGRGARVAANVAQDPKSAVLLHREGAADVLVKILGDVSADKTRTVIIRAIRYFSQPPYYCHHLLKDVFFPSGL